MARQKIDAGAAKALDASHEKGFKRPVCKAHRADVVSPDRAAPATVVHGECFTLFDEHPIAFGLLFPP